MENFALKVLEEKNKVIEDLRNELALTQKDMTEKVFQIRVLESKNIDNIIDKKVIAEQLIVDESYHIEKVDTQIVNDYHYRNLIDSKWLKFIKTDELKNEIINLAIKIYKQQLDKEKESEEDSNE